VYLCTHLPWVGRTFSKDMVAITFLRDHRTVVFTDKTAAARYIGVSAKTVHRYCQKRYPSIGSAVHGPLFITDKVDIEKSRRGNGGNYKQ
jgi:hypothetical protein